MDSAALLKALYQELEQAVPQLPLGQTAKDIVPGEGAADAQIMFIGEAPGYHESVERRPFVGVSGKFLRKTITEVGLGSELYYISNIVKVRPPANRDPLPEEILAFKPFLDREIEALKPKLVVTLGRFSMAKFLPEVKISQVHGRIHRLRWNGKIIYVLPMFHPAAALRATRVKDQFIEDMKKLPKVLQWLKDQSAAQQQVDLLKDTLL
ncbi:MAG: uracil-DNA glycosylase [Candidatus Pacebacteria bacterium CG_4_10_14_0_8_um_filter_43_12]|nr:MAG: uracil-DNA glycosylase [Candidatus Pacebacteria bacterium CG10_big_fil_rev_8_21_14_0_10_44_11]PIY79747.1 MAG: uracil-DNA glycosylase [Candidatus Pacebacteria bacterium CG_4_10_14_0_8_um_filter_43_12]